MKNLTVLLLTCLCLPNLLFSQEINDSENLQDCVDRLYGTNDLLVNGRTYVPVNTKASGHPFFAREEFTKGTIYVRSKAFVNVDIRYDVEKDQLVLRQNLNNGIPVQVVVTPALVDSFMINNHHFVNNTHVSSNNYGNGFMKELYASEIGFYQKTIKLFYPTYSKIHPNGRYGEEEVSYYLVRSGQMYEVRNKQDFLKYFSEHKKEIKLFLKQKSIRFRKATDNQFFNLLKYCNEIIR
ncbi:MAG: hypothetical protein DWQ02_10035 [Bacteroidetes bacterium]|nr:MAG: hypothetical protein DWQ02_10035 [Bacteroidota bacterium]